jgi:hypothetical protein
MCLPKPPKQTTPPVVVRDPVADEAKAQAEATSKANAELATRRRERFASRLTTAGARGSAPAQPGQSILAGAKAAIAAKKSTLGAP